ncbi:MAG: hypothetical protein IKI30_04930 [Oxalobacter sp.]|nr:hypothetical protein [Oxalobacter sp.]
MKLKEIKETYRKIPDTVRHCVTAALLWGTAVLLEYAPEAWRGISNIVSGLCLAGGLILIFFVVQRFLSERFNRAAMLQRMHAHVLYGRLNIIDAQLSAFLEKLGLLLYPQDMPGFPLLEKELPPLDDAAWESALMELVKASRLPREEQKNLGKAFEALHKLMQVWHEFKEKQGLEPSALMMWRDKLSQLASESLALLRKVIWHIEA